MTLEDLNDIRAKLDKIGDKIEKILVQTTATNGRVTQLEKDMNEAENNINELKATDNKTQGRDKVLHAIIYAMFTVVGFVIAHFISKI